MLNNDPIPCPTCGLPCIPDFVDESLLVHTGATLVAGGPRRCDTWQVPPPSVRLSPEGWASARLAVTGETW